MKKFNLILSFLLFSCFLVAQTQDICTTHPLNLNFSYENYVCLGGGSAVIIVRPEGGLPYSDGGQTEYTVSMKGSSLANHTIRTIDGVASFVVQDQDNWTVVITDELKCKPFIFQEQFRELSYDCPENLIAVYPGDANASGMASPQDILNIGLKYDFSGPARETASDDWGKTFAEPWSQTTQDGLNIAHVDCNGDGEINKLDFDALVENINLEHNLLNVVPEAYQDNTDGLILAFDLPEGDIEPGDFVSIPILFGDDKDPVEQLYGISFAVNYNKELIMPGTVSIDFNDNWLGDSDVDLIGLQTSNDGIGQAQLGMIRTNHANRSGKGKIATISFIIEDDIMGFRKEQLLFELEFDKVKAVSNNESLIPVQIKPTSFEVFTGIEINNTLQEFIEIAPNPANEQFIISFAELDSQIERIEISQVAGQKIVEYNNLSGTSLQVNTSGFAAGLYLVTFQTSKGVHTSKVRIQR